MGTWKLAESTRVQFRQNAEMARGGLHLRSWRLRSVVKSSRSGVNLRGYRRHARAVAGMIRLLLASFFPCLAQASRRKTPSAREVVSYMMKFSLGLLCLLPCLPSSCQWSVVLVARLAPSNALKDLLVDLES